MNVAKFIFLNHPWLISSVFVESYIRNGFNHSIVATLPYLPTWRYVWHYKYTTRQFFLQLETEWCQKRWGTSCRMHVTRCNWSRNVNLEKGRRLDYFACNSQQNYLLRDRLQREEFRSQLIFQLHCIANCRMDIGHWVSFIEITWFDLSSDWWGHN